MHTFCAAIQSANPSGCSATKAGLVVGSAVGAAVEV
jgi:hypothetical protein